MSTGAPDFWLRGLRIDLIDLVNTVTLIKKIEEITKILGIDNITNIASLDLVDRVTLIDTISAVTNIASVDLIDRITLIDKISKIGEISTIKDVMVPAQSLIMNPHFQQGLAGWIVYGSVTQTEDALGRAYVDFAGGAYGHLEQLFPLVLKTDWISDLHFYVKSPSTGVDVIKVRIWYTDGTEQAAQVYQVSLADAWEKKTITTPPGKYMRQIRFQHDSAYPNSQIRELTTEI